MSSETMSSLAHAAGRITAKRWTHILVPLLFLYVINFIDRNNIGFAVIGGMNADLHIDNAAAGLAGGVFYIGYLILQIPGGILAERFDVKRLIVGLAIGWGVLAIATGLVQDLIQLLVLRFLLGLIEGAVWPAILVMLSRWFTDRERSTANSIWLLCLPLSFVIMGPISGLIVEATSWRWLFIIEGFPAVLFALLVLAVGAAKPQQAGWLPRAERDYILNGQAGTTERVKVTGFRQAVLHPQVLLLSAIYLFWLLGAVGFFTWAPAIMKQISSASLVNTGLLSTLPYLAALVGLLVVGRFADRTRRRKVFVGVDLACLALFLLVSTLFTGNHIASLACLVAAGFFLFAMHAPFWAIPMETVPQHLTGAAIGMISLIGNIGSFIGPYLMGYVQQATNSFTAGLYVLVASLLVAAVLTVFVRERRVAEVTGAVAVHA
ncbi:MFS transporter [Saccharopolyspora sp. K220]|uniref:MFS transporter n=1 Tax=Saccharopolyspora soli TaxID=2926618 RepID=UPI001F57656D|nr:MFS transporter [Saccharopolyspora soli]MCI2422332.1 MFS transporter [Saccharopolyspora soli]